MLLGQRTGRLAETCDSGKGLAYRPRYATRAKDWHAGRGTRLRAKDWWTGRDIRLEQRTGVLAVAHDSGKGLADWSRYVTRAKDWRIDQDTRLGQRTDVLTKICDSGKGLVRWPRHATLGKGLVDWPRYATQAKNWRFRHLLGKSKRCCPYKPHVDGGEGSLLILLLSEPSDLIPLGRSVPFCLLTDQVGIASTPSFSVSSFSSSLSSPIPPSREERRRSNDSSGNQSVPESSSSGVMTGAEAKVLQASEIMKSLHDFDSTICLESLGLVRSILAFRTSMPFMHIGRGSNHTTLVLGGSVFPSTPWRQG
ncbi:hypothetical protein B296_00027477 [Ensete ventricosum]|uniref:Uncharacterized protein n=1 Tax=Ensete ventricosum TaxID=4639 RepID=A0A426YKY2_ENSVE|nr:hypothetical protein B296_00027477 [Ensete ventricosum]